MKNFLWSIATSGLLLALPITQAASLTNARPSSLVVMTYNLRYATSTPPNAWPQRRPVMQELIRRVAPDVLGTQEGLYGQIQDLAADLPAYDWIGTGRDGGSRGEFMAVFFNKARLQPLAFDHFWLSDTPAVIGSTTWGNSNRRMVTWVKFRNRTTGGEFFLFNTHFDHEVQSAREKSAELVRQRVGALDTRLPVLLIGDFNAAAGANKAYEILTGDRFFSDAWILAAQRRGEGINTFNGFKPAQHNGVRIDWILTRGEVAVDEAETLTYAENTQFPSDHFPVVARLRLGAGK